MNEQLLNSATIQSIVQLALREDAAYNDITTTNLIPNHHHENFSLIANEKGILSGLKLLKEVMNQMSENIQIKLMKDDGYDPSVYGHKQIVDRVSEDKERVTKGSVIVTSTSIHIIPNFELILIPRRSPDAIASLVCDNPRAQMASEKCKGNIRDFFDYLNFSDEKDVFKSSKDIIVDILCHTGSFDVSSAVHEHGHIVDVVHGNYTLSKNANHSAIINSLSLADVYDTIMYKGDWELMPYYINSGMAIPKQYMGDPLKSTHIQPGSTWTKYGNYKMRYNKLRSIQTRHANRIGLEELCVIRQYAIAGNFEPLINYKLTPNDFDVMNHLAVGNKLKAAEVTKVKKKLRTMINE